MNYLILYCFGIKIVRQLDLAETMNYSELVLVLALTKINIICSKFRIFDWTAWKNLLAVVTWEIPWLYRHRCDYRLWLVRSSHNWISMWSSGRIFISQRFPVKKFKDLNILLSVDFKIENPQLRILNSQCHPFFRHFMDKSSRWKCMHTG